MADDRPESMMRRTEFDTEPDDPAQFTRYVKADRFYALAAERDDLEARCRLLEAERNTARTDALNEAAAAIRAHADKHAPRDGNFSQQRMRRHLRIAEQVVLNCDPPSLAEVSEAFADAARGLPVPETQEQQT